MTTVEQRLDEIDGSLRRICYELDALAGAMRKLLEASQCHADAVQFMARFDAAKNSDERPTQPPATVESG